MFNHLRALTQDRRDPLARPVAGALDLIVPTCARIPADGTASFAAAFAAHGPRFPVAVRDAVP